MSTPQTPPHSTEAEQSLLGCILMDSQGADGSRVWDLCQAQGLPPEAFYDPRCREIYENLTEMKGCPIDALTLSEKLTGRGRLESIGGMAFINTLIDITPTPAHAEHYLRIVREKHLRRKVLENASKAIARALNEHDWPDAETLLGETEKDFLGIVPHTGTTATWSSTVRRTGESLVTALYGDGTQFEGLRTGLRDLDEKLLGLKPGEMTIIAARPSVGKTSLAMNIAERTAEAGLPVLVFSLEMPREQLSKRMTAGRAGVSLWHLIRNKYPEAQKSVIEDSIRKATDAISKLPIIVDDSPQVDIADLRARARRVNRQTPLGLIVIDYLQLCECRSVDSSGGQLYAVTRISKEIKAMAKELKTPVIALSQLRRPTGAKADESDDGYLRPTTAQLRESGAIEQDADVILLMNRTRNEPIEGEPSGGIVTVINVAKNRNGETGETKAVFDPSHTQFVNRSIVRTLD